jgi:hypothetical protein
LVARWRAEGSRAWIGAGALRTDGHVDPLLGQVDQPIAELPFYVQSRMPFDERVWFRTNTLDSQGRARA